MELVKQQQLNNGVLVYPDVHLAGSFVNLNTETGLAVNQNFFIQNKSSKDVIIVTSPTQPMSLEDGIHLRAYEEFILPPTTDYYWAYGFGDIQFVSYLTQITVTGQPISTTSLNLDQSIRYYPSLTQPKIQTASNDIKITIEFALVPTSIIVP